MKIFSPSIFSLLVLIFGMNCSTKNTNEPSTQNFINTEWNLESIGISAYETIIPPDSQKYTITFLPDGTFSGRNACNIIGGRYQLSENSKLVFEQLGTTYAGCPHGTIHDEYYKALDSLRDNKSMYEIRKNRLYIYYDKSLRIIFKAANS